MSKAQGREAFIEIKNIPIETVGNGIKRQVLAYGDHIMICRVEFEKDSVGDVHNHYHSQSTYIESGKFLVSIDGIEKVMTSGDSFFIEPHLNHGSVCLEAGVLIDTFSPMREDFLSNGEDI